MNWIYKTLLVVISITGVVFVSITSPIHASAPFNSSNPLTNDLPKNWTLIKYFQQQEFIPGIGLRTTALFAAEGLIIKAYCLDPGLPTPPIGSVCRLDVNGIFQCGGILQRFRPIPEKPTPTPTPTPTPKPLTCDDLGLGLHVVYGKSSTLVNPSSRVLALITNTREFQLEPLAIAPAEIWNKNPIHMVTPKETCGTFTVNGEVVDLPPEVKDIQVSVNCPGIHLDLSSESADGNYCFGCNDILFSQKMCTVTNKLTIQSDGQTQVCQAFYLVIDPPIQTTRNGR